MKRKFLIIMGTICLINASYGSPIDSTLVVNVNMTSNVGDFSTPEWDTCASDTNIGGHHCYPDWQKNVGSRNDTTQTLANFLPAVEIGLLQRSVIKNNPVAFYKEGTCASGPYTLVDKSYIPPGSSPLTWYPLIEVQNAISNPDDGTTHTFNVNVVYNGLVNGSQQFTFSGCTYQ